MAALNNRVILRSLSEETFNFSGSNVISVNAIESVDIISGKLAIDTAEMIVIYVQGEGENIRTLPYGTPVWHYIGTDLIRKHYVKEIRQIEKNRFAISTVSAIGLLDKQYHKGGMYTGQTVDDVLDELIDDVVTYTVDQDVAAVRVFGYLPYATKRDNLHQLLFAENISIVKDANGDMRFTFAKPVQSPPEIPENRIFIGGTIKYPAVASKVRMTEHSYQDVRTVEPVTLVDNSDQTPVTNKLYVFSEAPIVTTSLVASGDLTIVECGVNYAILTGQGVLTGRPYYDKHTTIEKTYNSDGEDYTVTVEDATLVTGVNSDNVASRLVSYYTSGEIVNADLKVNAEKCGGIYQFVDMFGSTIQAFLTKMTSGVSSFIKAACEFIAGYVPATFGNNYEYWGYVTGNGTITIQEGTKLARFVIIGGGSGGSSGLKGIDDSNDLQAGGVGGEGGFGGNGGKIREVILRNPTPGVYTCSAGLGGAAGAQCASTQTRNQGSAGNASTVTCPDGTTVYSSADSAAYYSKNGIKNLFTDDVYAKKGRDGCKGGNGGRGSTAGNGEPGEDVVWDGVTRRGGKGGQGLKFKFTHVDQTIANGGAGGNGAQAYADGAQGGSVSVQDYTDATASHSGYQAYEYGHFDQASPHVTVNPSQVVQDQNYGDGGDGGHGGGGRGGFGSANDYYSSASDPKTNKKIYLKMTFNGYYVPEAYASADGGAGNSGRGGIILCYADKELFF